MNSFVKTFFEAHYSKYKFSGECNLLQVPLQIKSRISGINTGYTGSESRKKTSQEEAQDIEIQ